MSDTPELRDKIVSVLAVHATASAAAAAAIERVVIAPLLAESQAQTANALRWLDQERELAKRTSESERARLTGAQLDVLERGKALDRAEASRRDWAAEAEEMTFVVQQRHRDLARAINRPPATEWNELLNEGTRLAERWLDEIAAEVRAVPVDLGAWICACVTEQQAADLVAAGWSLPQCTVHPPEVPEDAGEVPEPEPDWSALKDACYDYYCAYMHEDDSPLPAALDKVRRALAGEDPYATPVSAEARADDGRARPGGTTDGAT